ncbi:MAG: sulfatase [Planctomycetota bacterium]
MPRIVLLLLCCLGASLSTACQAPTRPNVVLIIGDDQAWTDFGFMGHPEIRTPNLDRLAEGGVLFSRAYVPTSLCRPSLASIVTGQYPHQHRITSNDPPKGTDRQEMLRHIDRAETLPDRLHRAGYRSFQTGKWWEGSYERGGFDGGMTHGDPSRGGRHGDEGLKIGREGLAPIASFLNRDDDRPFFLWYAPFLPHTPHNPPERLLKKYRADGRPEPIAKYMAMCEWFDETCGELLTLLEETGQRENTLVLFITDNGWINRPDASRYAPRSKRSPYEGGVRAPMIVSWPGHVSPRIDTALASSIDIAPTVLRAAGLVPPRELPGIDLLAMAEEPAQRDTIFGEIFTHDAVDLDDPAASLLYRWCIRGRWKLIVPTSPDEPIELFDVIADPTELRDLAAEHPDVVRDLAAALDRWWTVERT